MMEAHRAFNVHAASDVGSVGALARAPLPPGNPETPFPFSVPKNPMKCARERTPLPSSRPQPPQTDVRPQPAKPEPKLIRSIAKRLVSNGGRDKTMSGMCRRRRRSRISSTVKLRPLFLLRLLWVARQVRNLVGVHFLLLRLDLHGLLRCLKIHF